MPLVALFSLVALFQSGQIPASALPAVPSSDKVVARVNGEEIRAKDIEPLLWDWRGYEVTQDVITYRLIEGEAKKVGVSVPPAEVEKRFSAELAKMQAAVPAGQNLDEALREHGIPRSRLYLRIHTELLMDKIVLNGFHASDFVRISTAAYRPKTEAATDLQEAISRGTAAYDRLKKGNTWQKEVAASDDDPNLKAQSGLMGWRNVSAFPAGTQAELKTARPGGITKPVQAGGAIQIFRVEARGEGADAKDLDELRAAYLQQARPQLLTRLRNDAKIERLLSIK